MTTTVQVNSHIFDSVESTETECVKQLFGNVPHNTKLLVVDFPRAVVLLPTQVSDTTVRMGASIVRKPVNRESLNSKHAWKKAMKQFVTHPVLVDLTSSTQLVKFLNSKDYVKLLRHLVFKYVYGSRSELLRSFYVTEDNVETLVNKTYEKPLIFHFHEHTGIITTAVRILSDTELEFGASYYVKSHMDSTKKGVMQTLGSIFKNKSAGSKAVDMILQGIAPNLHRDYKASYDRKLFNTIALGRLKKHPVRVPVEELPLDLRETVLEAAKKHSRTSHTVDHIKTN